MSVMQVHDKNHPPCATAELELHRELPPGFERKLPNSYTKITSVPKRKTNPPLPCINTPEEREKSDPLDSCIDWLDLNVEKIERVPWSVHHSNALGSMNCSTSTNRLLPLWSNQVSDRGLLERAMTVVSDMTNELNPGQICVISGDQPVYTDLKMIQWDKPNVYGADRYMIMMGGLHIEMCFEAVIGDYVERSGWAYLIAISKITSSGNLSF